nr:hypothetical protein Hi04_10k_c4039_00008 [uncultured bacterium]
MKGCDLGIVLRAKGEAVQVNASEPGNVPYIAPSRFEIGGDKRIYQHLSNLQPVRGRAFAPGQDPGYLLFSRQGSLLAQPFDWRKLEA